MQSWGEEPCDRALEIALILEMPWIEWFCRFGGVSSGAESCSVNPLLGKTIVSGDFLLGTTPAGWSVFFFSWRQLPVLGAISRIWGPPLICAASISEQQPAV